MEKIKFVIPILIIVILGVVTGFLFSRKAAPGVSVGSQLVQTVQTTKEEGVTNLALFPDQAVGTVKINDGKITKEGSHILIRDGIGQNAYLTSSVIDLNKYLDKKIQVWGKTYGAQKAGWLMDIGRIKLVE